MFFSSNRPGVSTPATDALTGSSSDHKPACSATRRRRMSALALAVAMAAPAVRGAFGETAASPLVVDPAAAEARAAANDGEVLLAQAQTGSAADTLKQGVNQYKSGNYEDAVATLQSIDTSTLSDKERKTLNDALAKAGAAADQRRAARAEFEQGQADLNDNKPGSAITHFQNAAENKYADKGTQNKAREQMALAETMRKGMAADMKKLYSQAVASYKAGDLAGARTSFRQLVDMGYKAGAFQKSPQDFINAINKKIGAEAPAAPQAELTPAAPAEATPAAPVADSAVAQATPTAPAPSEAPAPAPAPAETPAATAAPAPESTPAVEAAAPAAEATATVTAADARRAYLRGRDQYRKGDWINARKNLEIAQNAGYKPGLFEDKPSVILARMDRKEQADSARAAKRAEAMAAADAARQPAAQATEAAPTAVAQAAPSEPAAPAAPAAPAEPAPAQPATPQQELQSTAQLDRIRAEQSAAEARQLVEQARTAQQANRYAEALDLYSRAQQLDPNNAQAAAGAREMAAMAGRGAGGTNLLDRQAESTNVARGEITYTINTEIDNALQASKAGDFNRAREALNRASSATQINPQAFTEQENRAFRSRIDQTQVAVNTAETDFRNRQATDEQNRINREIEEQRLASDASRRRTVADLINNSKRLVNETRYAEALGVIDQILVLEPTNDYASGVRPLVEDKAHLQDQRRSREEHDRQLTKQLNAAEEMKIPYNDILRYPVNWPDISELRDQTTATELGGTPADQATQLLLERRLPELKLDNIPFTDVIDALRDLTNANIFVNWRALESEGVDRAAPVTARLRDVKFAKALDTILKDVGGGTVNLGYTIDDGVITISTQTDLAKNTLTRVYDIRDLIVEIPDFADAPQFQLQQSSSTSGRGGGGGGGQSLFGGQTQGQGQGEGDRAALITEIQELIQETVDPESWREAGGSVGSIRVLGGNLIVNQTPENHRALQGLLEQLRESQSIQITIEARFLTVQRNFLEDIGVDVDFIFNADADANDKWSPIPVNNNSAVFTANPITGIPGSIGNVAPTTIDPEDPLSVGVGALGLSGTYLDNFAVTFLVRATQAMQNSTVVTAPRVTLSNGQRGYVVVSTQTAYVSDLEPVVGTRSVGFDPTISIIESGILLDVQGTVSADRKYVTLTLRPTLSRLAALQPFTVQSAAQTTGGDDDNTNPVDTGIATATLQQPIVERTLVRTTVTVPDGGTLLLGGQTLAGEIEREAGVPVLSKIPFLKRLFTNRSMAKDEQVLLILVKPTIIIAKEQERKQFPVLSTRVGG